MQNRSETHQIDIKFTNQSYIITLTTDTAKTIYTIPDDAINSGSGKKSSHTNLFPGVVIIDGILYVNNKPIDTYPHEKTVEKSDTSKVKTNIPSDFNTTDRSSIQKVLGVDPDKLVTLNGKSIVKSVEMTQGSNNNDTVTITLSPLSFGTKIVSHNGQTLFYRNGKPIKKDTPGHKNNNSNYNRPS